MGIALARLIHTLEDCQTCAYAQVLKKKATQLELDGQPEPVDSRI